MTGSTMSAATRVLVILVIAGSVIENHADENLADTIKLLREQVAALLYHRQEDYNALEASLKTAIEKNTELFVLRNEVIQLRKEVNSLRGLNGNGNGNGNLNEIGNEAKNERLRVRWLGSAVTELQSEVGQVLRSMNASEELAERSRMRSELALLKGDVAEIGRGVRNLGGRIAKIEATLGTIRVDIAAVKERSSLITRTCADITSQLNSMQIEVKSLKCEPSLKPEAKTFVLSDAEGKERFGTDRLREKMREDHIRRRTNRRHSYSHKIESYRGRFEDRLKSLERKISVVSQKRALLERRVTYESQEWPSLAKRIKSLEKLELELSERISNVTEEVGVVRRSGEAIASRLFDSVNAFEETIEANRTETSQQLARLGVNAAQKAAELSLTREELSNLRRAVQALSVSASKLQERSDKQQQAINSLNSSLAQLPEFEKSNESQLFSDCERDAGVKINTENAKIPCRKGWTLVARRTDGSLDFDRSWNEYSIGFGSATREFWIGNQILHTLTRDNCTMLRVDLLDIYGERWQAEYDLFNVDSEKTGYKLKVDGYTGNATDALSYQNGMAFSAKDRDMDISRGDCAGNYHGGWWFGRCQHANLNGKYSLGLTWFRSDSNSWMPIASSEMFVRRKQTCRPLSLIASIR